MIASPSKPVRVATYSRISTDEAHQPYSLEAQAERLGSYIRSQESWEPVAAFTDRLSGSTVDRPGLQAALNAATAKAFDVLLVYRVDRLSRSVRGLAEILDRLDRSGVAFRSATEPFDTGSPAGRMMVQMLGVFAEFERATIIDRVVAGMERKAARGGWNGGQRPFGYLIDRETGGLRPHPEEAPVVPIIFDLYLKERLGTRAIAERLNRDGHRTRSGRPWTFLSILTVLRNRAYAGEINFRGKQHPSQHPHLVAPAVLDAAQQLLGERRENIALRATNSSDYLLSGILRCDRCGGPFVGTAAQGSTQSYHYYTCLTRQKLRRGYCDAPRIPAGELDGLVWARLVQQCLEDDLLKWAVERAQRHRHDALGPRRQQLAGLELEIRKTGEGIGRYLRAFEEGALAAGDLEERVATLRQRQRQLRSRRAELAAELAADNRPPANGVPSEVIQQALGNAPNALRKALARALLESATAAGRDDVKLALRCSAS